jgi:hypothetical protein
MRGRNFMPNTAHFIADTLRRLKELSGDERRNGQR